MKQKNAEDIIKYERGIRIKFMIVVISKRKDIQILISYLLVLGDKYE